MSDSTVPERQGSIPSSPPVELVSGLVVIWCPNEADRIGAWLSVREGTWILGRGGARADDAHPRLAMVRQRPGANLTVPFFENAALSRVQLLCRSEGKELHLENVGQCRLLVNGREEQKCVVRSGELVELGSQIAFLCAARPLRLPGDPASWHAFGEPDEHGFVGESPAAWQLRAAMKFAGSRSLHVLIRGDTGTGKEIVARALHALSERKGPFVARNAATLPEALVDAELFGNADGYPNAGMRERKGLVGAADKGTLFLDEIAELPESQQTHFLRVLDAGEYQRLGEAAMRRSDLRVVAATNRPSSTLREDVVARFGFTIRVTNLSERREDIPLLVTHLLSAIAAEDPELAERFFHDKRPRLSPTLMRELVLRPPSGNVRGLRSLLWRALAESPAEVIEAPRDWEPESSGRGETVASELDGRRVQDALNEHGGSLEKTWRALGLPSRFALMRLMKKHRISVKKQAAETD